VPEDQPKLKVFQPFLGGVVRQSPSRLDDEIPHIRLEFKGCVAILEVEMLVLVLQIVLDIEFGMFLQRLSPMEVAGFSRPSMETFGSSDP
jgi:hypothetical protein